MSLLCFHLTEVNKYYCNPTLAIEVRISAQFTQPLSTLFTSIITCFTVPFQALLPAFCNAYEDPAILGDARVLANMLWVERAYVPAPPALCYGRDGTQDEIKPHMRRIVVEWMLDVCVDQRCNVDVFLLATNIIDRFLSTIRLEE